MVRLHTLLSYRPKSGTIVFSIAGSFKWAQFQVTASCINKVALLDMFFILELACNACSAGNSEITNVHQEVNFGDKSAIIFK